MKPRARLFVMSLVALGALPPRPANAQPSSDEARAPRTPAAPTAGPTGSGADSPEDASVRVQIDSSLAASLEGLPEGQTNWRTLCRAPCGELAPLAGMYRVTTPRGSSATFHLDGAAGETVGLSVDAPSRAARVARPVLFATGGVELGAGLVALLLAGIESAKACDNDGCGSPGAPPSVTTPIAYAGLASLVGGAISLVAGANLATVASVTQRMLPGVPAIPDGNAEIRPRAAFWRPAPTESALIPASTSAPVISLAF